MSWSNHLRFFSSSPQISYAQLAILFHALPGGFAAGGDELNHLYFLKKNIFCWNHSVV